MHLHAFSYESSSSLYLLCNVCLYGRISPSYCIHSYFLVVKFFSVSALLLFSARGGVSVLSNAQIAEHYADCIKLSTENVSQLCVGVH